MFKVPYLPSPKADPNQIADFAELLCWQEKTTSSREIIAYLGRIDENDDNFGCNDDDDKNSDTIEEVMNEIECRKIACGSGYPFSLDLEGTVLRHELANGGCKSEIYRFMLLCTVLDMKSNRVHAGINGTLLFEEICAKVLKNYLGGERARSLVIGTSSTVSFEDKIRDLCQQLGEGSGFRSLNEKPVQDKDGKLDVVAWVPFSDQKTGKLIIFSQCKTGSSWRKDTAQLQPSAFITKWIDGPIAVLPVRSFCVTEACNRSCWNTDCIDAGILFDRCRIVDFCENIEGNLLNKVRNWTSAAKKSVYYSSSS